MKILQILPTFLFILLSPIGIGQFAFNYVDSISVIKSGSQLNMPWAGGLNYAQFSDIDYDFDGDMDLLVFDRSRIKLSCLKTNNCQANPFMSSILLGKMFFLKICGIVYLLSIIMVTIKKIFSPME